MATREEYRGRAETCLKAAEKLHDPGERVKLLEVARGYLVLARYVAERGIARRSADPEYRTNDA